MESVSSVVDSRRSIVVSRWSIVASFIFTLYVGAGFSRTVDERLPELTQQVHDFADIIDAANAAAMDRMIRQLEAATGDAVVVATVHTTEPYGDIREYANKLFENHGRGIGVKEKKNGLPILVALKER